VDGSDASIGDGSPAGGDGPVVEELCFALDADELDRWLTWEAASWDDYLSGQPGFLHKEVWLGSDDEPPGTVPVLVWWASSAQWHAVPGEELEVRGAAMGPLWRTSRCRAHTVLRQL
jgi:uncharacterized protein (TIGR03792 family)